METPEYKLFRATVRILALLAVAALGSSGGAQEVRVYRSADGGYHFAGSRDDAVGPREWEAWRQYWQTHRVPGEGHEKPPPYPHSPKAVARIDPPSAKVAEEVPCLEARR